MFLMVCRHTAGRLNSRCPIGCFRFRLSAPAKFLADHSEENSQHGSDNRPQKQSEKPKGLDASENEKQQHQRMQLHLPAYHPWPDNVVGGADHHHSPDKNEHALPGRASKDEVESGGGPNQGGTDDGHNGRERRTKTEKEWRFRSHDGKRNARQARLGRTRRKEFRTRWQRWCRICC